MKKNRKIVFKSYKRTNNQLRKKLNFIKSESYNLDDAIQVIEEISVILRKALDGNNSLFFQLNYEYHRVFPNYQTNEMGANLVQENKLVNLFFSINNSGYQYKDFIKPEWFSTIQYWWNEVVLNDKDDVLVTRRDIVKTIADKEGGAHYDPDYNKDYFKMCKINSDSEEIQMTISKNIYFSSILTIAEEYLYAVNTLERDLRSQKVSSAKIKDINIMVRKYKNKDKRPKYQFNIFKIRDELFLDAIYIRLEQRYECITYLSKANESIFIDNFSNMGYKKIVYENSSALNRLEYIIDVNRGLKAIGLNNRNKFILLKNSKIVDRYDKDINKKEKSNLDRLGGNLVLKTDMEFRNKKEAKIFILNKTNKDLKWGDFYLKN